MCNEMKPKDISDFFASEKIQIVAHRGLSGRAPENTFSAFTAAIECGASMIELDVALTKDQEIVVCHNPTVDQTTDGSGYIHEMTLVKLKN